MRADSLKITSGIILVVSHIGALLYMAIEYRNRMTTADLIDTALVLSPVFGLYTTAVVADAVATREDRSRGPKLSFMFVFVTHAFLFTFSALIFLALFGYTVGDIETEEELRRSLAAIETMLGVILGLIVRTVFPHGSGEQPQRPDESSSPE